MSELILSSVHDVQTIDVQTTDEMKQVVNLNRPERSSFPHFCPQALSPCSLDDLSPCTPIAQVESPEEICLPYNLLLSVAM